MQDNSETPNPPRTKQQFRAVLGELPWTGTAGRLNPLDVLPETPAISIDPIASAMASAFAPPIETADDSAISMLVAAALAIARATDGGRVKTATPAEVVALMERATLAMRTAFKVTT